MTSAQFLLPILRQRLVISRPIHTSIARRSEIENNFAKSFNDNFKDHGKKQQKHLLEPTRLIQIEALPFTSTSEDVRKLAREAFPKGDRSIIDMVFSRKDNLAFDGKCIVLMSTPEDASRLLSYGDRRSMGGNIIKMSFTGKTAGNPEGYLNNFRRNELKSVTEATNAAGRSVIMSGFPFNYTDYVLGYLRAKNFYPVDGVPDNIVCISDKQRTPINKFLVKFESESEAWRCVRTFHNEKYTIRRNQSTYNIQVDVVY
ncbi:unnamed protein product [Rhizopus stolonifer]